MSAIIRRGEGQDLVHVLGLIREFAQFQRTPEKVSVTLEQMLDEKELFNCFIAEDANGNITGFVSFFFCYYSWTGKAIYMDDLYVQPGSRGQGLGTGLLKAVAEYGKTHQCVKLRWQVSNWNEAAIGFYKSLGATIDEVEINCDFNLPGAV